MASLDIYRQKSIHSGLLNTSLCPKCRRVGTKCSCHNGLLPAVGHALYMSGFHSQSFSEDDILDIGNEEASTGNDLDIADPTCDKSDQHDEFIDIEDFALDDLPEHIRHPAFVVWIRNCVPLVVRLNNSKNATGRVMLFPPHMGKSLRCRNLNCPHRQYRGPRHEIYGGLAIITNKHVVKSNEEASRTRVEFFYHSVEDRQLVMKEMGLELNTTNRAMDHTVFTCTAHSEDLIDMVKMLLMKVNIAWCAIPVPFRRRSKEFAVVISHPHGTAKKISIGDKIKTSIRDDAGDARDNVILLRNLYNACARNNRGLARFAVYYSLVKDIPLLNSVTYYMAATCKGSSGAPVYMGNVVQENDMENNLPHTHRGRDPVEGYNVCFT